MAPIVYTGALAALAVSFSGFASAAAGQTAVLTGNEDFTISNVGEGFLFGPTRRDAVDSRFQINGRNPDGADRNFGLWAAFNLDLNGLFAGPIGGLESVTIDLFEAQPITGQDIDNIITGGTLNLYYTLEDADVLDAANGFDWIDSDPEGLGDQFADRVLVGSVDVVDGNSGASFDLDLATIESSLVNEINNDGFIRFVLTTPDMDTATSFGVGAPGTSTVLAFDGPAPTVSFVVPAPASAALLGLGGLAAVRRRR
ncbi:MAG: PEP-CTERM sorting domain-containing protein [Planctomycetota bacterium]